MTNATIEVAATTHTHYESTRIQAPIIVSSATASGGAGTTVEVTLSADSMFGGKSFSQAGEVGIILRTGVKVYVVSTTGANPDVYTIKPLLTTDDIGQLVNGDNITFFSISWHNCKTRI